MITLAHALRRRTLALVAVLAALGVVVAGIVAVSPAPQKPAATCGYVFQTTILGTYQVWRCWGAGGGGGGSW